MKKSLSALEKTDFISQEGFSELFWQTHIQVYRYLYGLTGGPPDDVDDLVAESFARAWSARKNFRGDFNAALRWLLKIAKHQVIDSYRKRKTFGDVASLETHEPPSSDESPEDQFFSSEQREILWGLLQTLPEEPREMLVLRYMLDWSIGEIAKYTNKNQTAVSMAISRTLKRLQQSWPSTDPTFETRSKLNV